MSLNSLLLITLLKSLTGKAMENRILMADLKIMLPILCLSTHSIRSGCQWYSNGGFNLPANSLLPSDRGQQRPVWWGKAAVDSRHFLILGLGLQLPRKGKWCVHKEEIETYEYRNTLSIKSECFLFLQTLPNWKRKEAESTWKWDLWLQNHISEIQISQVSNYTEEWLIMGWLIPVFPPELLFHNGQENIP